MTVNVTSPVTGAAQTGFTAPTYTHVLDNAPDNNGRQWAVTALGGTQAGVTVSSVSSPFTMLFVKPKVLKGLSVIDPVTGVLRSIPRNEYFFKTVKGAIPLTGQAPVACSAKTIYSIAAGTDTVSPSEIRAMVSLHIGAQTQQSAGIGDTLVSGVF
jgi:hypothetical protein